MEQKKGMFVVFEGIDGSGKGTQIIQLVEYIKKLDKYQDVIITHEPWKSKRIKNRLEEEKDAFSSGLEIANLFVNDRVEHVKKLIVPNVRRGIFVLSDRYALSTIAYQSAQGVPVKVLLEMHRGKGVLVPDVTFFIDVPSNVVESRLKKRGESIEKFEKREFRDVLIRQYRDLIKNAQDNGYVFGKVILIDGTGEISDIAKRIREEFEVFYKDRRNRE